MNRPIAIFLIVLIIACLIFSTFALFQGDLAAGISVFPLIIIVFFFIQFSKKK